MYLIVLLVYLLFIVYIRLSRFRVILLTSVDTNPKKEAVMAKAARSSKLETRTSRQKLSKGVRHWQPVGEGLTLCYRRTADGFGSWAIRIIDGRDRKQTLVKLGSADDNVDADGENVMTFYQAQERGREIAKAPRPKGRPVTVAEIVATYMTWYEEHRKGFAETRNVVDAHILPVFGTRMAGDLSTTEIREWHEQLAATPPKRRSAIGRPPKYGAKPKTSDAKRSRKSTANRILTVLKAILNRAYRDEMVADDSPWRRVKPFENADEPVTRFLTNAEAMRLINVCRADLRQLLKGALFTGARFNELASLAVADVNVDTAAIYLRPSKSGKGRHVPLSAEGLDFFRSAVAGKTGKQRAFTRADGEPWGKNHHVRLLKEACSAALIEPPISFHELRHTYASLLAQAGADLLTISKLLGHADTRVTSRHYAHLCDKTLATAVRTLLPSFGHTMEKKIKSIR